MPLWAQVILLAAVLNGLLLPFISGLLLLCLNHSTLMRGQPQPTAANALLVPCVGLSLLLASVVVTTRLAAHQSDAWRLAAPAAALGTALLARASSGLRGATRGGDESPARAAFGLWLESRVRQIRRLRAAGSAAGRHAKLHDLEPATDRQPPDLGGR